MQPFRIETVVASDHVLTLKDVPFRAGERVQVTVVSLSHQLDGEPYPLRGKPMRYVAPFDSVAEDDGDLLR